MNYALSFRRYQRPFVKPLRTAQGEWSMREGFIVRVERGAMTGYGEVAPIPAFGTETMDAAEACLQSLAADNKLPETITGLSELPCCAFGISAAVSGDPLFPKRDYSVAALLPAGETALAVLLSKFKQGYTSFKWKMGVEPVAKEQAILMKLLEQLPRGAKLRLDANGGLSIGSLESWLALLQDYLQQIDYLEQPLPVGQELLMADYAASSCVPIALDESLNGTEGMQWLTIGAWQGPLVVKPALMGDCKHLIERLRPVASQVVLSSVFETAVGLKTALLLADQLPELKRAIGFGTLGAFADDLMFLSDGPVISVAERGQLNVAGVWEQLG